MDRLPFLSAWKWVGVAVLGLGIAGTAGVAAAQVITEFPVLTPHSEPTGIAAGPDGRLWFTETVANRIGRITPTGLVTEFFVLTPDSEPTGITAGPDGRLWFTEFAGNRIGRITPTGLVTEFPVLTVSSQPYGIATGPDGNLWFTEFAGNRIGRITPTGVVVEFAIPTAASGPTGITAGPDGRLWFTETVANKIGRITPTGLITEFLVPTPDSQPAGITAGPDGNLWFTELAGNKIGRITPTGLITEFLVLTPDSQPIGITAGPDGNLWFTEFAADNIGRITPTGLVTEFSVLSAPAGPFAITAGPPGTLWFTERTANRIGRLTLSGVTLTVQKAGTGQGTVTSAPAGISCGSTCIASFPPGTAVTLTATAAKGSIFIGWSGACTGLGACTPPLSAATTVTATFRLPPANLVTVAVNQTQFAAGQTVVGSATLNDPGLPIIVDLFLGVVLPDGDTIVFFTAGGTGTTLGRRSDVTTFRPIAAGVSLAQPLTVAAPALFSHTWTAVDLPGDYVFFFIAAAPGAFSRGSTGPPELFGTSTVTFTFQP